jgi:hypothetical protein
MPHARCFSSRSPGVLNNPVSADFNTAKPLDKVIDDYARPLIDLLTLLVDQPSSLLTLKVAKRPRGKNQLTPPYNSYEVGIRTNQDSSADTSLPQGMQANNG